MKKDLWYEIIMAFVLLLVLASVAFHARKNQKAPLTPPESLYTPHERLVR